MTCVEGRGFVSVDAQKSPSTFHLCPASSTIIFSAISFLLTRPDPLYGLRQKASNITVPHQSSCENPTNYAP